MQQYTYLLINIACLFIPFVASFYPRHSFFKEWRYFVPANLLVSIGFLIWDYYYTQMGIWGFNPDYLMGVYILNLPLEEILFFLCIPYACVFTYFALQHLVKKNPFHSIQHVITGFILILLLVAGILSLERLYTSVTLLLTAVYLAFHLYRKSDLSFLYLAYLVIIPFFLVSNGILTGSGLNEPIVWYDNSENLGIRLMTIPVEDAVYGFLLIMMNIDLYKQIKRRLNYSAGQ